MRTGAPNTASCWCRGIPTGCRGLRDTLDTDEATLENAKVSHAIKGSFPICPWWRSAFRTSSDLVTKSIKRIGITQASSPVIEDCVHNLTLERPTVLTTRLGDVVTEPS